MHRLLEVLDDFELALMHATEKRRTSTGSCTASSSSTRSSSDALKAEGLERIDAEGQPFDPELHEALMQTGRGRRRAASWPTSCGPGYTLRGRVIRPAGVRVERE